MDSDYLSQPQVVAASRNFVCALLATYENEEESAFLKSLYHGPFGGLENTVFAIFAPDGETQLIEPGRGPDHVFGGGFRSRSTTADRRNAMVRKMQQISRDYPGKDPGSLQDPTLPTTRNFRVALNVASCEDRPLLAVVAENESQLQALESKLAKLAWSEEFIGQFFYASVTDRSALRSIQGLDDDADILIIQPDPFGLEGTALAQLNAEDSTTKLREGMALGLERYTLMQKEMRSHVSKGNRQGVNWETLIPMTDLGPGPWQMIGSVPADKRAELNESVNLMRDEGVSTGAIRNYLLNEFTGFGGRGPGGKGSSRGGGKGASSGSKGFAGGKGPPRGGRR